MRRNAMARNLQQSIRRSLGRYLAIMAIIALGSSIFVGLRMTKADMVATGQKYMQQQNMFDIRLVSTYGWSEEQVEQAALLEEVRDAEGQIYMDVIMSDSRTGKEGTYRLYSIPEKINMPVLLGGRMPENDSECLADGYHTDDSILGSVITVSDSNEKDTLEALPDRSYTVVGYVGSPLYMDMNRGTTSVGNGSIVNYFLLPRSAFDIDYYTEIHLTLPEQYPVYSQEYNTALDNALDALEPKSMLLAQNRFDQVRVEAEQAYAEGVQEYTDGLRELNDAKLEVEQELADALLKLEDGKKELEKGRAELLSGERQLEEGEKQYQQGLEAIETVRTSITAERDNALKMIDRQEAALGDEEEQLKIQLEVLESGIESANNAMERTDAALQAAYGKGAQQIKAEIDALDAAIREKEEALFAAREEGDQEIISQLEGEIQELQQERESLNRAYAPYAVLVSTKEELEARKEKLESGDGQIIIDAGMLERERQLVNESYDYAMEQLEATVTQLEESAAQLNAARAQLNAGWDKLFEGEKELAQGWKDYEEGKQKAETEISDAEAKLEEGWLELVDGRQEINAMEKVERYQLDRTSNLGYNSLNSSSDIVAGVSRVFPVFFLLVAALVCITTMTRMVDEERTQIGTLKALGYSNGAIMGKYLMYALSGAVIGCGLGVALGSIIFPGILWEAYKIMLFIPGSLVLTVDWGLCLGVVGMYTAAILLVTWYCCYRTLAEVPAELIRPKPPAVGKRLLFERLRLWRRISFLNKVTIRNIFRYRQRLAMMIVGVGGCTALLLTGFGLRDSIVNIVDIQFTEVTVYDMSVYFSEGRTELEQELFQRKLGDKADNLMFYYQISAEMEANNKTRKLYLMAADQKVEEFIDFHKRSEKVAYPGTDQVLLSVGCAEAMGIDIGDTVTLRDSDMQSMTLTVSGIYDNHVENYAIVSPETVAKHWGEPQMQMALIKAAPGQDAHELSAVVSGMDDVMNVSVSEDMASMVRSMMDALDLVVIVIVICAALLAAIVLYNLTNININERLREIATIKVLGFRAGETAMYIFKENLTLSVMGTAVGLLFGRVLLEFVMSQIKIDMVWLQARALTPSYIWSVVLTIVTALIVDFIFYFKLEKINMAEALKSVE